MKFSPKYLVFLFAFAVVLLSGDLAAQCAMCKEAAASSLKNDPSSMARSLNSGILYLMAIPYILLMIIFRKQIATIWRKLRGKESRSHL